MNILKPLQNKRGSYTILIVILCLIAVIAISGTVEIIKRAYILNEIQSIMDVAGTSALQSGVDETKLRVEIFDLDQSVVRSNFQQICNAEITEGNDIVSFTMLNNDIDVNVFNSTWGLGTSSKSRPQARLDAVARVRITSESIFDTVPFVAKTYYNSFSNTDFTVSYAGITSDGNIELIIRSVSRIVYR